MKSHLNGIWSWNSSASNVFNHRVTNNKNLFRIFHFPRIYFKIIFRIIWNNLIRIFLSSFTCWLIYSNNLFPWLLTYFAYFFFLLFSLPNDGVLLNILVIILVKFQESIILMENRFYHPLFCHRLCHCFVIVTSERIFCK